MASTKPETIQPAALGATARMTLVQSLMIVLRLKSAKKADYENHQQKRREAQNKMASPCRGKKRATMRVSLTPWLLVFNYELVPDRLAAEIDQANDTESDYRD